ncbi:retrotransposon protein, putative, ty1-copia subclass [Tanacetum coccineum]|uniref:Retrotransposon protein, putative, ty1-copia subclass n=1 Tax=Tanacetum coccineum TaxID=301880 RepID=A0ABQ5AE19_9ASTR
MYKQIFWEKNTNACTAQVINHAKPQHGLLVGNFVKEDGCNKLHGYVVDDDDGIFPQHNQHANPNGFGSIKTAVIWNPAINKTVAIDVPDVLDALPYNYITVFGFGVCPHTSDPKLVKIICSHKMVGEKKFKSFPERSLRFLISFSTLESLPGLGDQLCTAQSMLYLGSGLLDSIEGSSPSPVRVQLFFLRLDLVGRGEENTGLDSSLPFPPGFTPADQVKSDRKNSPLHSHSDVLILVQASWRNAALLKIRLVKLWVLRWKGVRKTWRKLLDLKEFAMVSNELFIPKCSRLDPRPKRNDQGVKQQTTRLNFLSYSYTKSDHISDMDIKSMGNKRTKPNLDSSYLWHCRLAHINKKRIEKLQHDGLLKPTDNEPFDQCVSCISGKMTRKPFSHKTEKVKDVLGLIHTDVCGPLRHVSKKGASYFITFTDDYSRYGYVYLLKHKHEVFETFKVFKNEVENQLGKTIKAIRSDRGGEYISQEFKDYLKAYGIVQQLTPPYTPQHNGVSERRNRTLLNMVRSMMSLKTLPLSFWDYALESAARILNMVPIKKVRGCEAHVKRHTPDKLQQRYVKCIFVGHPKETMGYYFYYPPENKIVVERYADFLEKDFILQKESERNVELDDEDILPFENTSEHPIEEENLAPIKMNCDNSAAIIIAKDSGIQKGARHFQRKYHYVRECIKTDEIDIVKVHTYENLADPFTKALAGPKLTRHARSMDVRNLLDDVFLAKAPIATRWIKYVPIKLNVFAWKVHLNRLPTRVNLQHRGVLVSDPSCPICHSEDEDVGMSPSRRIAWDEIIGKVSNRLSKWKIKTLSVGGRLTLIKSVLTSLPLYHMSLYKAPLGVLRDLEFLRRNFFNGADIH